MENTNKPEEEFENFSQKRSTLSLITKKEKCPGIYFPEMLLWWIVKGITQSLLLFIYYGIGEYQT